MTAKKKFLNSFSAPQQFFDELAVGKEDVVDVSFGMYSFTANKHLLLQPFAETRRKAISERETEYQKRWRKRKLSPTQHDPFARKKGTEGESGGRCVWLFNLLLCFVVTFIFFQAIQGYHC